MYKQCRIFILRGNLMLRIIRIKQEHKVAKGQFANLFHSAIVFLIGSDYFNRLTASFQLEDCSVIEYKDYVTLPFEINK